MWTNQGCEELLHQMDEKLVELLNIWLMDSDHMSDVENQVFGILVTFSEANVWTKRWLHVPNVNGYILATITLWHEKFKNRVDAL